MPVRVQDFKKQWRDRFGPVLDTKYLSETHEALSGHNPPSTLKGLADFMVALGTDSELSFELDQVEGEAYTLPASLSPEAVDRDLSHEAGYDALLTSLVLLNQLDQVFRQRRLTWDRVDFLPVRSYSARDASRSVCDLLPLATNRVKLVKTQPSAMDLAGREEADMSRHLLMSSFPTSWKKYELMKVWAPVWVTISWVDDQSAWIIARSDEDVQNLQLIYSMIAEPQFKLETYDEYRQRTA